MNVAILSLMLLCAVIHHCDCLPRTDNDVKIEDKVASLLRRLTKTNDDERPLEQDRGTNEHIPIPTDKRTAINRQGDDGCSGTPVEHTAHSGTIQSPGYATFTYPDNSDCQWRITAPSGYVISVTFQELSLEPGQGCRFDSVTLYDGSSTNSPQLGKYCSDNPGTVTSTGSSLFIRFISDYSVHDGRFSLSWSFVSQGGQGDDACSGTPVEHTAHSGTIQSPGYDTSSYPDDSDCQWRITASSGYVISVTFQELSVEPVEGCPYDSVTLYDGSSANSPQLGKYCSGDPGTITSTGSSLFIRFTSDYSVHNGRFSLSWSFVSQGGQASCGSPTVEPDFSMMRIVGGVEARKHSWPWQCNVAPFHHRPPYCGATVIDEYHILTAAHCVVDDGVQAPGDSVTIACGRHNWQDSSEEHTTEQKFKGVTVIVHENYGDAFYDVAIIRLPSPLTFNDYVQPICLPSSPVAVGTNCVAIGWGETRGTGDQNVLRQVYLPAISWSDCYDAYFPRYGSWVKEYMMCAGPMVSSKSVCFGDSGGPLVCKQGDKWFQYGVSSFLYDNDCHVPKPSGFADVVYYLPWIEQHTGIGASARMKSEHISKQPTPPPVKKHPLEKNVPKPPHPLELIEKERRNKDRSKPAEDPYEVEKELLDLLQRKFADD